MCITRCVKFIAAAQQNVNFLMRHFRRFMEDVNTIQRRFFSVPDLDDFRYLLNLPNLMTKLTDPILQSHTSANSYKNKIL